MALKPHALERAQRLQVGAPVKLHKCLANLGAVTFVSFDGKLWIRVKNETGEYRVRAGYVVD